MRDRPGCPIVLIERRLPPLGWALPGALVDVGEGVETAAVCEAREETGLDVWLTALLRVYLIGEAPFAPALGLHSQKVYSGEDLFRPMSSILDREGGSPR